MSTPPISWKSPCNGLNPTIKNHDGSKPMAITNTVCRRQHRYLLVWDIWHQTSYSNCRSPATAQINSQVGVKILSDDSWRNGSIPEIASSQVSGIGLYLQLQIAQASCSVMIQAYAEHVPSPL